MMQRAWSSIVEVPYCFSRSNVKLQGHTALKIVEFDPNWAFPDCNSRLNSPMAMLHKAYNSKGEMPYCFPRSSINFQGHTVQNITDFDPNWAFQDYKPVADFKSLRFALFKGHPSNFKVTRNKKLSILTRIEHLPTVNSVWIHPWLWIDAQSLMWYRRDALLFFKVIHQISRSRGTKKIYQYWPELSVSGL